MFITSDKPPGRPVSKNGVTAFEIFFGSTFLIFRSDRLCGLVVRFPGYRTEMYCASCKVRTGYVEESRPPLWSSGQSSWLQNGDALFSVRYELNYIQK
jgi:hypothetical protein